MTLHLDLENRSARAMIVRQVVREYWSCGMTRGQIANLLGCTRRYVERVLDELGVAGPRFATDAEAELYAQTQCPYTYKHTLALREQFAKRTEMED